MIRKLNLLFSFILFQTSIFTVSYFNDSFAIVWREKYLHKSTI